MGKIKSKTLFLTTSPRSPEKMVPELKLLLSNFEGKQWDKDAQAQFMADLRETDFFNGLGTKDPAFSARDRINRAPKALGFVSLTPTIEWTEAGRAFLSGDNVQEILLRQLLKFQIPSPYHILGEEAADFWVKPYLEILRLIRKLGTLKFDELQIFGMQLTNWHNFDNIVKKILGFRSDRLTHQGRYADFKREVLLRELRSIYASQINNGSLKIRENDKTSVEDALLTKGRNMRDYADACFRYLRATGLVNVSYVGKSLSIEKERVEEVDFILNKIDRNPLQFDNEEAYIAYLGDALTPTLLTDDKDYLLSSIKRLFPAYHIDKQYTLSELKGRLQTLVAARQKENINKQVSEIKRYALYDEIQALFDKITSAQIYDPALMLEWNTWRAMTMLDGGNIKANLKFDDYGMPLSNAQGNKGDIECEYGDFNLLVEVTLQSGQRQYESEGEPVSRHLGNLKNKTNKECYCLFIAPTINNACIAHFYSLHNMNISYYGGKSVIVPLPLNVFRT